MSNPYDISSGYLAARQMKNEEARLGLLKPYYEAEADKAKESTRGLRISNELKSMKNSWIKDVFAKRKGIGFKAEGADLSGISNGEYTLGVKSPDDFKADYSLTPKARGLSPEDQQLAAEFADVESYADGTPGGLGLKMPAPAPVAEPVVEPKAAAAGPHPNSVNAQGTSAFSTLQENDPAKAENLAGNIFGASPKEFQKMIGDFALIDWADDKISSKGLMDQVNAVKKMQAEGLGSAMQYALAGNYEKAIAKFDESGDVRGESIAKIEKYQIKNPVAGAVRGTKDTYDGVKITHKDGSVDFLDPRRLLAETVSLKEVIDNEYRFGHSIRTADTDAYRTDAMNAANTESRAARSDEKLRTEQGLAASRYTNAFNLLRDDMLKNLATTTNRSEILTDGAENKKATAEIMSKLGPAQNLAALNIQLAQQGGSLTASTDALIKYAEASQSPEFFRSNNPLLRKDASGQFAGIEKDGVQFVQTIDGVYIPRPPRPQNTQSR